MSQRSTDPGEKGVRSRRWLRLSFAVLFIAAFAGMMVVALRHGTLPLADVGIAVLAVQPPILLVAVLLSWRLWRIAGPPATFAGAFWANAAFDTLSFLLPVRLSELAKPAVLNLNDRVPTGRGLAATGVERLLDVACLGALASLAVLGAWGDQAAPLWWGAIALWTLLGLGIVVIAVLLAVPKLTDAVVQRLPFPWLARLVSDMLAVLRRLRSPPIAAQAAASTALIWAVSFTVYIMLVGMAGTLRLDAGQVLVVYVAATLGHVATVTPSGLGTFEAAIVLALMAFGYPLADATTLALAIRLAMVLGAVGPAILFLMFSRVGFDAIAGHLSTRGAGR